jgi:hypothetical protein
LGVLLGKTRHPKKKIKMIIFFGFFYHLFGLFEEFRVSYYLFIFVDQSVLLLLFIYFSQEHAIDIFIIIILVQGNWVWRNRLFSMFEASVQQERKPKTPA